MLGSKDVKDRLNEREQEIERFRQELKILQFYIFTEEKKIKRKKRIRKFIRKKIIERKRREAFPRKAGKYNELFQDFGKESGVHIHPDK